MLSEKQKIKAENVLLKRDNAKLEREVQQGPGVARQEVMVGLMAQVQSLTKVLKDKNKCTDDEQGLVPVAYSYYNIIISLIGQEC